MSISGPSPKARVKEFSERKKREGTKCLGKQKRERKHLILPGHILELETKELKSSQRTGNCKGTGAGRESEQSGTALSLATNRVRAKEQW